MDDRVYPFRAPVPNDETIISAPKVLPWTRFPECPKCGGSLGAGIRLAAIWRALHGECAQAYSYCAGDQNSTVRVPGLNMTTGEMGSMDIKTACFGVFHEHLHLRCGRCSFAWLMAVKGENSK